MSLQITGEILTNSVSIMILRNGFACQHLFHGQIGRPGSCFGWGIKTNRWCAIMCGLDMVAITKPKMPNLNMLSGSSWKDETKLIDRGKEDFEMGCAEQTMPPWGNVVITHDVDLKPEIESANSSQTEREDTFFGEMVPLDENKVYFLEETDEGVLSERVLVLSRTNRVRSVLELFWSMELSSLCPNLHACNSLLACLFRNGLVDDGLRVFEFMKRNEIASGHTYSLLLKAVADARGCDLALDMFVELAEECKVRKDFDVIVYNTVISICGKSNNWVESDRIWRSMRDSGIAGTQITYSLLMSVFVRCNQNELALDAYNEMMQNGLKPDIDIMQAVISACAKEGKWELALNVFENMLGAELKPNLITCNALINSLGKAGKVKLAFQIYDVMISIDHTPDEYTWNALLGALYRANRYAEALQLFGSIKKEPGSPLNLHLYNTALKCCSKLRLWEKAVQLLWQMEASGLSVSTTSYNHVISACETARRPKIALQVYEHMVHQKCNPDTFTHLSLLRGCIWGSLWNKVEEIMDIVEPNVSVYNVVIQGMCLKGNIDSAKKLYGKMREAGLTPDGKTRALMLQNLPKHSVRQRKQRPSHY